MCICLRCVDFTSRCAIAVKMQSEEHQRRKEILCTYLENPDLSYREIGSEIGDDMKKKWNATQKQVGPSFIQNLMSSVKRKFRAFGIEIE